MSKLPKSLEKIKETEGNKVQIPHFAKSFSERAGHIASWKDGFDSGALEVKRRADKLAEASRAFLLNRSIENSQKLNSALAEWDEFWNF